jgi:DNA-binding MarR family transcriptional regulator
MTKRLDRLVEAGFVTRRMSEMDGRARVVALTAEGQAVIDRAFTEHMANEHRLLGGLSSQQSQDLELLLTTWLYQFEKPIHIP